MDQVAALRNEITMNGLESLNRYYGDYMGFVVDNEDGDFLGRLKVRVPEIHGTKGYAKNWAWSKGVFSGVQTGAFYIPKKGDTVWVSFMAGDPSKPVWSYGWFGKGDVVEQAKIKGNKNYLFQAGGHRLEFDEEVNLVRITHKDGLMFCIKKDTIELGKQAFEKIILGQTFMQFFNAHVHLGNLGAPTSTPMVPMSEAQLSQISKTQ